MPPCLQIIDVFEEVKTYRFPNFISDFGGYLGLLLGGSIPGLIEMFQSAYARCTKCTKSKISLKKKRPNSAAK